MLIINSHLHRSARADLVKKAGLACGLVSSMLFVAIDIFATCQWTEYSYADQTFSELAAVEAPTRSLMIMALSIPYNILMIAFALGIWKSRGRNPSFRIIASMLFIHAVVGLMGSIFFPMHSRGEERV